MHDGVKLSHICLIQIMDVKLRSIIGVFSMYRSILSNIIFSSNHTINSFFINYTNEEIEVFH